MSEIATTDARQRLAAIIDTDHRNKLIEDSDELADIRAVDAAWKESGRLCETPIPWEDVKRALGLS